MAIPKKLSKEQIEINKNKQRLLNSAGYNVKVDGSWGPWQEQQYNKLMSRGRMFTDKRAVDKAAQAKWENDHNKAIAGYYFSDTPTLPNLAKGTYHWLMGNVFGDSENPEYYRMNVGDAPSDIVGPAEATKLPTTAKEFVQAVKNFRVPTLRTLFGQPTKDINVGRLSSTTRSQAPVITTVAGSSNQVPIRVANINLSPNPVVVEAPEVIQSASRMPAVYGSTTRTIAERVGQRPSGVINNTTGAKTFQRGYDKGLKEGQAQKQGLDDALRASQSQIIERDQQIQQLTEELKLLREGKVAQETAQAAEPTIRVVEPTVSQTAPAQAAAQAAPAQASQAAQAPAAVDSGKGFWGNLQRALWETKGNNFGKYYTIRNVTRGAGYPFIIPPILGTLYENVPEAFRSYGDYAKKSFNYGRGKSAVQDSTPVNSTGRDSSQTTQSKDSSQVQQSQSVFPQAKDGVIRAEDMQAVIDSLLEL